MENKRNKTGGRTKGTPNRLSGSTKEFLSSILDRNRERAEAELNALSGKEFLDIYTKLLGFVTPKMSSISVEAQIKAEIEALSELLRTAPEEAIEKISERMDNIIKQREEGSV